MSNRPAIAVILGSTREGRISPTVGAWFMRLAAERKDLTVELIDLKEWNLPMFNDANLPSTGNYSFEITKRWSAKIASFDGYVLVTPEYNNGYSAVLKNALDYLYREWNRKPVAFVGYGGPAAGTRAVQQLKQVVLDLQMVPVRASVLIPRVSQSFDNEGNVREPWPKVGAANLLNQLVWWANVLKTARENSQFPQPVTS